MSSVLTQCFSFSDSNYSNVLLNLDKPPPSPGRFAGHRNYLGDTEPSPWQDHGLPGGQPSVTAMFGSDLKSMTTLFRERTRPERISSATSWGVAPRWEEIARRQYEQQRTAAGLDPSLSYFRHYVDGDLSLSMRSYRRKCTVEDVGKSLKTFDQLNEDEDPYLRKFRISGDLDERLRLLMLITNSSAPAATASATVTSNVLFYSTARGHPEQSEQKPGIQRPDPASSSSPNQSPPFPAPAQLNYSKSTISASLPGQADQVFRSSSSTGSGKPDDDNYADRMKSIREVVFSYVRDIQRPLLTAKSGPGPGPLRDSPRPITRQKSQTSRCQTAHKSTHLSTPSAIRTSSRMADYRVVLTTGPRQDFTNAAPRKRAESSRAVMNQYVVTPGLMRQTISSGARKRQLRTLCSPKTARVPYQEGNSNTMIVRLG